MRWLRSFLIISLRKTLSLIFLLLGGLCAQAVAQPGDVFFPDQPVVYTTKNPDIAYGLTLSALKKVNGEWLAEREPLVQGQLLGRTVEVGRPYTFETAWQHVQARFSELTSALVFSCEGLDCGSSNAWANEHFGIDKLYGLDLMQRYQVWQLSYQNVNYFASAYLVQRGNKRVYFQLDVLRPKDQTLSFAPGAQVIGDIFYRDRQVELGGIRFDQGNIIVDKEYLKAYAKAFNQRPFHSLLIVGHDYHPGDSQAQEQRSLAHAKAVKEVLTSLGVQPRRMEAKGVGAMAPKPNRQAPARVVVLLK